MSYETDTTGSNTMPLGWTLAFLVGPPAGVKANPNDFGSLPSRILRSDLHNVIDSNIRLGNIYSPAGVVVAFTHSGKSARETHSQQPLGADTAFYESVLEMQSVVYYSATKILPINAVHMGKAREVAARGTLDTDDLLSVLPSYEDQFRAVEAEQARFWSSEVWHQAFEASVPIEF